MMIGNLNFWLLLLINKHHGSEIADQAIFAGITHAGHILW